MKEHIISATEKNSIAEELGIEAGDRLLTIDGQEIADIFDYRMFERQENLTVLIRKKKAYEENCPQNGENRQDSTTDEPAAETKRDCAKETTDVNAEEGENLWEFAIEKEAEEELGLLFENAMMDNYRSCRNGCVFCFIDQMPKGMRKTLYFKDDDARLSFLQGNYETLTNMTDAEIDRILQYHLSPINISFHTTEPDLRVQMLRNPQAGKALEKAKRLVGEDTGITLNGQIVLCKGINDGVHLDRSMQDLYEDYAPNLGSVSVVPVGLTKHRDKLTHLESFTQEDALKVIAQIENFQKKAIAERGNAFIYASDEWYLLAHQDEIAKAQGDCSSGKLEFRNIGSLIDRILPADTAYDGYPQIENGVGMLRNLITEVRGGLNKLKNDDSYKTYLSEYNNEISFVTGQLAYPVIGMLLAEATALAPGLTCLLYAIKNEYFGEKITVSGLLTGTDIMAQLTGKPLGKRLYLPANLLRDGEDVLLDDVHLPEIAEKLGVPVATNGHTGYDLITALFELAPAYFAEENAVSGYGNTYELSETNG